MNMREMFVKTTKELIENDSKVALILGGISVASFSESINKYPERVFDAGIMEQGNISIASGLAITGMIPIFHTIAPFLVERAYEQLKIDFGYQKLGGNFISNGASIDYSSFGATHQCPAEIGLLKLIPGMQVIVPGTPEEFRALYLQTYNNGCPTYIRLSRDINKESRDVTFGKGSVVKRGSEGTIIAVGPMLQMVLDAVDGLDVTVLYYTTVAPFDTDTFLNNIASDKLLVCEPYYEGALDYEITKALPNPVKISHVGLPHEFCKYYGNTVDNYKAMGLTVENIRKQTLALIGKRDD